MTPVGGNSSGALICYFLHSVWNIWIDSQETSQTAASPPLHPPTPNSSAFPCQHVLNWSVCACVYSYAYSMCVFVCVPGQRLKSSNLKHRIVSWFRPIVQAAKCSKRQIGERMKATVKCLHLADHFIQRDLQCIQSMFYELNTSLGISPMTWLWVRAMQYQLSYRNLQEPQKSGCACSFMLSILGIFRICMFYYVCILPSADFKIEIFGPLF